MDPHEIPGRKIDVIPVEKLAHPVKQKILPPANLAAAESAGVDFNGGRGGRLPIAERFNKTKVKNRVVQEFVRNGMPTFAHRFEMNFGCEGNIGRDGEFEPGSDA